MDDKERSVYCGRLVEGSPQRLFVSFSKGDLQRHQPNLLIESVEAFVNAIAAGTIEVALPTEGIQKDKVRTAPSFIASSRKQETSKDDTGSVSSRFTPLSIADFLGKASKNGAGEAVRAVIRRLDFMTSMTSMELNNSTYRAITRWLRQTRLGLLRRATRLHCRECGELQRVVDFSGGSSIAVLDCQHRRQLFLRSEDELFAYEIARHARQSRRRVNIGKSAGSQWVKVYEEDLGAA